MKSVFLIDGFNLYHAITNEFNHGKYKWLNLKELSKQFIEEDEEIKKVLFFTAYVTWDVGKRERHKNFVTALSSKGIEIVKGNFKSVEKKFQKNKMSVSESNLPHEELPEYIKFRTFEEKETDVNIAVKILEYASTNEYDKLYIVSGDSDFIPAIKSAKKHYRKTKFINILPIGGKGISLGQVCDEQHIMTEEHIKASIMEEEVIIGSVRIKKPESWK